MAETFDIAAVPSFIFCQASDRRVLDRVDGAHAHQLTQMVEKYAKRASEQITAPIHDTSASAVSSSEQDLESRLKQLTTMAPVVLFMKGTPAEPRCGFSRQIVALLKQAGIRFSTFDILQDDEVRQGLKTFANWPTYPQLWVQGELVGGLDIVKEMIANGELQSMLPPLESETTDKPKEASESRLKALIEKAPLMIFIKGSPNEPQCGFSRQLIAILAELGATYDYFDILSDQQVREGLKKYSNWPTYPQVYVKGELIGGLDIVKELVDSGEFQSLLESI